MAESDKGEELSSAPADGAREDRRRFLKLVLLGGGVVAGGALAGKSLLEHFVPTTEDPRNVSPSPGASWVMLIDLDKCDGCGVCTTACQQAHFVPFQQQWIRVYRVTDEKGASYYLPRPCFNCRNAPCAKVCPVGATHIAKDGIVLVDHTRCIGCRYCMAACPYNARSFNWTEPTHTAEELAHTYSEAAPWPHQKGVVEKCMFCAHDARQGMLPACSRGCPMGAIYFGNETEDAVTNGLGETLPFRATLAKEGGFRWKEELGTDPRVYYLPARR